MQGRSIVAIHAEKLRIAGATAFRAILVTSANAHQRPYAHYQVLTTNEGPEMIRQTMVRACQVMGVIATTAVLAACGGGGGGDSAGTPSAGTGSLRVALTDAPSCGYDHVYITIEKVRVHQSSTAADADAGWTELALSPARRIDLLDLTNGVLEELGTMPLPAG